MPCFGVLYHDMPTTTERSDHWDLMLETTSPAVFDPQTKSLETWALDGQPLPGRTLAARQLEDHRAWYLDNEGSVSQDEALLRGS